jgi:glc operon protein GlcG
MHNRVVLDAADARAVMLAARGEAERLGLEVSIAVVDEGGVLLALERLDRARLHTPEAAWLKARTAAITRSETAALQAQADAHPAMLSFPGRMPLVGGVPLSVAGVVVGGVGSSGGTPEQDLAVCHAAVAAFGGLGA